MIKIVVREAGRSRGEDAEKFELVKGRFCTRFVTVIVTENPFFLGYPKLLSPNTDKEHLSMGPTVKMVWLCACVIC